MTVNTIADNVRKKVEKVFCILFISILANPLLANMKMKKNWNEVPFNSKVQRFNKKTMQQEDQFLGPGCYEAKGDFDEFALENRSNPLVSKVIYNLYCLF